MSFLVITSASDVLIIGSVVYDNGVSDACVSVCCMKRRIEVATPPLAL